MSWTGKSFCGSAGTRVDSQHACVTERRLALEASPDHADFCRMLSALANFVRAFLTEKTLTRTCLDPRAGNPGHSLTAKGLWVNFMYGAFTVSLLSCASRGSRHSRKRACDPWRGGGKAPLLPLWSSCASKSRVSSPDGGGSVGMCAWA